MKWKWNEKRMKIKWTQNWNESEMKRKGNKTKMRGVDRRRQQLRQLMMAASASTNHACNCINRWRWQSNQQYTFAGIKLYKIIQQSATYRKAVHHWQLIPRQAIQNTAHTRIHQWDDTTQNFMTVARYFNTARGNGKLSWIVATNNITRSSINLYYDFFIGALYQY